MGETKQPDKVLGLNGVEVPQRATSGTRFRTYEVHQRERVGQSTEKIKPLQLISREFADDPYPYLTILRENYPCFRDWLSNVYWVTRYDDVTSILRDEPNFETRPKTWYYGLDAPGRNLNDALPVLYAVERGMDAHSETLAEALFADMAKSGGGNLALDFAGRFAMKMRAHLWGVPDADLIRFSQLYWTMQRGVGWEPNAKAAGLAAIAEMRELLDRLLAERRESRGEDVVSALLEADAAVSADDAVTTLLETDHETLHGALANLWCLLLGNPDELARVIEEPRFLKFAYLETLRHSQPVVWVNRFTRHEVERFGLLLPEGALVRCSVLAANRDPRIFEDPDRFIADRRDMCHREARGQYRADGLATGISPGTGTPSLHPAIPEDRPRSLFAITRDNALAASAVVLENARRLQLDGTVSPRMRSVRVGDMRTCWELPVRIG